MSEAVASELRAGSPAAINALTGIRAIIATWVVIEHFQYELYGLWPATKRIDWWIESGYLGVEVFFVLSGFIISYNYAYRLHSGAGRYTDFLVNRFARIYPVHLVTLLAVAALVVAAAVTHVPLNSSTRYTPLSFVGNLFLLQAAPQIWPWDGPSWSISAEALAYVTFPLTAWMLARLTRPLHAALGAVIWVVAGTAAMMALRLVDPSTISPPMALLRIATEFVVGAMLWKAWSLAGQPQSPRWDVIAGGAFALTVAILAILPQREGLALIVTPVLALFVIACAGACGPVAWLLSTRLLVFGGKISYSLYMVHFIVVMVVAKLLPWEQFATSSLFVRSAVMIFYFAVCFAAAIACYLLIEEPARRAIQRAAKRSRSSRSSVS